MLAGVEGVELVLDDELVLEDELLEDELLLDEELEVSLLVVPEVP